MSFSIQTPSILLCINAINPNVLLAFYPNPSSTFQKKNEYSIRFFQLFPLLDQFRCFQNSVPGKGPMHRLPIPNGSTLHCWGLELRELCFLVLCDHATRVKYSCSCDSTKCKSDIDSNVNMTSPRPFGILYVLPIT